MKIIQCYLFIILSLLYTNSFAAAWTQGKGSLQTIVSTTGYQSSRYFDINGSRKKSDVTFTKSDFAPFFEYGLSDDLTIGVSTSFQKWTFDKKNPDDTIFDFRQCGLFDANRSFRVNTNTFEAELFLRKKLYDKDNWVFSVQPLVKTPCFVYANDNFQMAEKTMDAELRFLAGYGFQWEPGIYWNDWIRPFAGQYHFLSFDMAYRKRSDLFADQLKIDAAAGFRFNDDLLLLGQIFSTFSVGSEPIRGRYVNNQVVVQDGSYYTVKAQISAIQQIKKNKSIQVGLFKEIFGKNAGEGFGANVGLWQSF